VAAIIAFSVAPLVPDAATRWPPSRRSAVPQWRSAAALSATARPSMSRSAAPIREPETQGLREDGYEGVQGGGLGSRERPVLGPALEGECDGAGSRKLDHGAEAGAEPALAHEVLLEGVALVVPGPVEVALGDGAAEQLPVRRQGGPPVDEEPGLGEVVAQDVFAFPGGEARFGQHLGPKARLGRRFQEAPRQASERGGM